MQCHELHARGLWSGSVKGSATLDAGAKIFFEIRDPKSQAIFFPISSVKLRDLARDPSEILQNLSKILKSM